MRNFHIVWTILLLAVFVGIIVWAWSRKRKARFDEASRLPLEDEEPKNSDHSKQK